jgi:hypothetical protein
MISEIVVEMMGSRTRLLAGAMGGAGILFAMYPIIRPYSDEATLQGADSMASTAWVVGHMLAMAGFTLLTLGLLGVHHALQGTGTERLAFRALVVGMIGVGLTLPFYGAEAFGLQAISQAAVWRNDFSLMKVVESVRTGPQLVMFSMGLLLVGVSAIMVATAAWRSRVLPKWSGVPFALGFALYIPQFFGTQPIRVAHGLLVSLGCLSIAASLWQLSATESSRPEG